MLDLVMLVDLISNLFSFFLFHFLVGINLENCYFVMFDDINSSDVLM